MDRVFRFFGEKTALLLGKGRLSALPMVDLDAPMDDVVALYGEPVESEPAEDYPQATRHTFSAGPFHAVVITEVDGKARSIVYWSAHSSPTPDLRHVMERYGQGVGWRQVERGYWYWRQDDKVRLWCSAVPAIGVATSDYFEEKRVAEKQARAAAPIEFAEVVEWMADASIEEMRRRYVVGDRSSLQEFASRSRRVAFSSDALRVLVVRDHYRHDYKEGFSEQNRPPDAGACSVEVLNVFSWSSADEEAGFSWGKVALPRDCRVELIRFDGDQLEMKLCQVSSGRILSFIGPAQSVFSMRGDTALGDSHLWSCIEEVFAE